MQANESNKKAQGASYNRVEASDQMEATTSDTIRLAGEKAGRPMHGVWSVFGKPYAPMGLPTTVQHKLPALNRDDINGALQPPFVGASYGVVDAVVAWLHSRCTGADD